MERSRRTDLGRTFGILPCTGRFKSCKVISYFFVLPYFIKPRNQALTPAFSQLLSQLLYSQPELRPSVLRALKVMVESNTSPSLTGSTSSEVAEQNITFLKTQAESWLAVFFNVFGSVGRDGRGMVGDVISVWAAIAGEQVRIYNS